MRQINVNPLSIILEPFGRNTAPAIAIAALKAIDYLKEEDIDPISGFRKVTSDLQIRRREARSILESMIYKLFNSLDFLL